MAIGLRTPIFDPHLARAEAADIEVFNWIVVGPDNWVTVRSLQAELGQGITTGIVQLLSEELELDVSKVKTEYADVTRHLAQGKPFGRGQIGGSNSIISLQLPVRMAGAQIRLMFIRAAARRLGVLEDELFAELSTIVHEPTGTKLTYGELAHDAAAVPVPDKSEIKLKDPRDWKVVGKSMKRLDVPSKVNGSAIYGIDVTLPGMKYAAITHGPAIGAKLRSYDADPALSRRGVHKVFPVPAIEAVSAATAVLPGGRLSPENDAIAVVADSFWEAKTALDAMPVTWEGGYTNLSSESLLADMRAAFSAGPTKLLRKGGNVDEALRSATQVIEAEYYTPYRENAPMEPLTCTALVTEDGFEVWVATQNPETTLNTAALTAGFPIERGKVNMMPAGGSFGRRLDMDFVRQSVQIAMAMKGTPVKLIWTREETFRFSPYQPTFLTKIKGGLDANGNLIAWKQRIVGNSGYPGVGVSHVAGGELRFYDIPNITIDFVEVPNILRVSTMRGVVNSHESFFFQGFLDELAIAAKKDPYEFQKAIWRTTPVVPWRGTEGDMSARTRTVLDTVMQKSSWGSPLGANRGRGFAIDDKINVNTAVAQVVEVTLDGRGWFKVDRVVTVADPGHVVDPNNSNSLAEGSVAFGLTQAIYNEITFAHGLAVECNFDQYPMLRMAEMPKVETHLVPSYMGWGGMGEPMVPPILPALVNAIYNAGGPRIRSLPIKNVTISKRA